MKLTRVLARFSIATRIWVGIIALSLVLLSGVMGGIGSPGVLQMLQVRSVLRTKQAQIEELQNQIVKLEGEAVALEKSTIVQHREIRRVLGYAAPDEIIFDFSSRETL